MVHMQCILEDVRRIRLSICPSRFTSVSYEILLRGGVIHMYTHKWGGYNRIQTMGTSHHFILYHVVFLGISDNSVKFKKLCPVPMNIYNLNSYGLDSISCTISVRFVG